MDIALEAIEHQQRAGRSRYVAGCEGTQPLSKEAREYRRGLWLRMKSLNSLHKFCAAATTKPSDPETGCDSLALSVMAGGAAKAPAAQAA